MADTGLDTTDAFIAKWQGVTASELSTSQSFLSQTHARTAGEGVLEPALKMYHSALDSDTPTWAKATIIGSLGYFISPIDAIPDLAPLVGYSDDFGVLVAAVATVAAHIKEDHVRKARETLAQWFA